MSSVMLLKKAFIAEYFLHLVCWCRDILMSENRCSNCAGYGNYNDKYKKLFHSSLFYGFGLSILYSITISIIMDSHIAKENRTLSALAKPIVLVGLMGAGKTTVGRRLASELGVAFIDSDNEIAEAAECSISDIFAIYGEAIFRDLEKRVLIRLLGGGPMVIATGGGAFMNSDIRVAIKAQAISLWLRADIEVLLERVSRRNTRPLLETGDKREILTRLMQERDPVYSQADWIVDNNIGDHDKVVRAIVKLLTEQKLI